MHVCYLRTINPQKCNRWIIYFYLSIKRRIFTSMIILFILKFVQFIYNCNTIRNKQILYSFLYNNSFMGPSPSKLPEQDIANLSKNLLIKLAFPKVSQKFQRAQFFYKTKQMKIHVPVSNKKVIEELEQNIKHIHGHQMSPYLLIPKSYQFQKQGYCGSAGVCKIVYDYFPYSLEGEIQNRKKSIDNQQFTELEIWKLLFVLLKSCNMMHTNWKKVGDIRPKNIFYNEERQLRVSCQYSYPNQFTNYEKFIFQKQSTYLAPEQIQDIKMGRINQDTSRSAKQHMIEAESFTVGLTLLHVMELFNFEKIYDPIKTQMNMALLEQKIQDLENSQKYSLVLKNIVKGMVETIPERRLLTSELYKTVLSQYLKDMETMTPFNGSKLNFQVNQIMEKKSINSLIGTVWKACKTGFIESIVLHSQDPTLGMQTIPVSRVVENEQNTDRKQAFIEQIDKFSEIPKGSQVSRRDSIRLGGSRQKKGHGSSVQRKQSQISNQSFHTVNSISTNKRSIINSNFNRLSNFSIDNRFLGASKRLLTNGDHNSPSKINNFDHINDKCMTPSEQSSIFHTINGDKSFDFNNIIGMSSRLRRSQTLEQSNANILKKLQQHPFQIKQESQRHISANFKKEK